jgi:membrane protein YdbS with pleckstrin-like domain
MTISASGPFDPDDVVWHPVSTRLAAARLVVAGAVALVAFIPTVSLAAVVGGPWWWGAVAGELALTGWVAFLIPRQVRAIRYAERVDDLLVRRGIMFRRLVVVPYGRMQYVDVQAGPLARKLGVARVQLHTASPATDASIPGLGPAEADRLRDQLASRGEARLAGL